MNAKESEVLRTAFEQHGREIPPVAVRLQLASQLKCNQIRVYKWFWENKNKKDTRCLPSLARGTMTVREKFQSFFDLTKKGHHPSQLALEGHDAQGRKLLYDDLWSSVKFFCQESKKEHNISNLATLVEFDVDEAAAVAITEKDSMKMTIKVVECISEHPLDDEASMFDLFSGAEQATCPGDKEVQHHQEEEALSMLTDDKIFALHLLTGQILRGRFSNLS